MGSPGTSARIPQLMSKSFSQSLPLLWLGITGLILAAACSGIALVHGTMIPPEGDLTKVITFDAAVGFFVITIALFVPLARLRRGVCADGFASSLH